MNRTALFLIFIILTSCGMKKDKSTQDEASTRNEYLQKGGEVVGLSQAELLKNVAQAMSTGGPEYAVDFCNVHALSIKDSLSALYNCEIRRIAVKYRNPEDKPDNQTDTDVLGQYLHAHQMGESIGAEVFIFDDHIDYYHPILIQNGACLLCHGTPGEQINDQTMEIINTHYPADLATGFKMDDLRGAWKITFKR
jgi:hypothetical protein